MPKASKAARPAFTGFPKYPEEIEDTTPRARKEVAQ